MLKKFLIGTFAVVAMALMANMAMAAYDFGPTTLKVGSKGVYVSTLQTLVGATADGVFGPMTKAKVMAWQAANGLVADGVFGPLSMAKANAGTTVTPPVTGTYPEGCTSSVGYSTTTGLPCTSVATYPAGCTSTVGYSPTTGAKCDGSTTGSTALTGGAGTIDVTSTSTDVESHATENKADVKVFAFKVKANDSDIALTNVKLTLKNCESGCSSAAATTSEKLTNYIDSVKVVMGSTEVGSADAADFTKTTGDPDSFAKSIPLSGAVIKEGKTNTFWVEVSSGTVDSTNLDALWKVFLDSVRFQDATGVVMSEDETLSKQFSYQSASANDLLTIKTDTANPDASAVQVKENDSTNDVLIGAFKLKADASSSDITLNELPITVAIGSDTTPSSDEFADTVISALYVKIDGTRYDTDLTTDGTTATGDGGNVVYTADLTNDKVVISAGDTSEVKVYVDLNSQKNNYANGTTLKASLSSSKIDATGANDLTSGELSGTFTGETQTLNVNAVTVALVSSPTLAVSTHTDGTATGEEDIYKATFVFNVTAPDDTDIYLPLDTGTFNATHGVPFTVTGGATVTAAGLSSSTAKVYNDGSNDVGYRVSAGGTEKFTFSVYLVGNNQNGKVAIDSIWYELDGATGVPDGTPKITAGLNDFQTDLVYLAK